MRASIVKGPLTNGTLVVWVAMLGTGLIAWLGSATPIAGAAVVVAVLLAATSPTGALYATCAAIPLIFHPVEIGSLELGLLEVGILTTVLGTGFRFAYDTVSGNRWRLRPLLLPWGPLALGGLLLVSGSLSLVWMPFSLHRAEALRSWRWVIVEPLLAFALARLAISRDGRAPLAVAIALPAGAVAIAGIWQLADASSSFSVDEVHRSTATYLHPNNLALYLERALYLVLVPAMLMRNRARWLLFALSLAIAAGIGSTFSRGALLGLAAGGALVLLANPIRRGWRILLTGFAVLLAAFAVLASQRLSGADSSGLVSTRRYLWSDAVEMIRDFPVRGIGLDQFLWLHQQRYIDPRIWSERYVSHPHNLALDAWLSLGLPGIGLLAIFIGAGTWVVWRNRTGRTALDAWQLGGLACLGAGMGHGLVDNGYFLPDLAVMTWLALALVSTTTMIVSDESHAHD